MLDDHDLPVLDDLVQRMRQAHAQKRAVAVHCVTRVQAVLATAALADAGSFPGDRIEHGAVLGHGLLGVLAGLGVLVVTQPAMAAARGDRYLRDVEPDDVADLWRAASIRHAGVGLAGGTDAPHGPSDPWAVIRSAIERVTPAGRVLGPDERLEPSVALGLLLGHPDRPAISRRVVPGQPADLCVLSPSPMPWGDGEASPSVTATVVAGLVVHADV
jgi:predicted amidohydrolase YtcJ